MHHCICSHSVLWLRMSQYPVCGSLSLFSDMTESCVFFFVLVCVFCVVSCHPITKAHTGTKKVPAPLLVYFTPKFPLFVKEAKTIFPSYIIQNNENQNTALRLLYNFTSTIIIEAKHIRCFLKAFRTVGKNWKNTEWIHFVNPHYGRTETDISIWIRSLDNL